MQVSLNDSMLETTEVSSERNVLVSNHIVWLIIYFNKFKYEREQGYL